MIEFFGDIPPAQMIISAAAVVTAIIFLWTKVVRPISSAIKVVHGLDPRLREVETKAQELVTNSGTSLRDAVDRIERGQVHNSATLADHSKALGDHIEWEQGEFLRVWQTLAARDTVEAAKQAAAEIDQTAK